MKLRTPKSKNQFAWLFLFVWLSIPLADFLLLVIYLFMPHNPDSDSPGLGFLFWMMFTGGWFLVTTPFILMSVSYSYVNYTGSLGLITFNSNKPCASLASWTLNVFAIVWLIVCLHPILFFWRADSYHFTVLMCSIPSGIAALLFTYVCLSSSAEIMNDA